MMRLTGISFTRQGALLLSGIRESLMRRGDGFWVDAYGMEQYIEGTGLLPLSPGLFDFVKGLWEVTDAFVFIGATGIAVRAISPNLQGKTKDPAVLVIDELGEFVIPLLSGHIGRANELGLLLSRMLRAQPVITTATDIHGIFAVDVFARKNGLSISSMELAKHVSAGLLGGESVGFYCEGRVKGTMPVGLIPVDTQGNETEKKPDMGIYVGVYEKFRPFRRTLQLVPKAVALGIGCRRRAAAGEIERKALEALWQNRLSIQSVKQVASIDIKKEEEGILAFCDKYKLPFLTFSAEELQAAEGEFTDSDFVASVAGIGNVCERAAVVAGGTIIQRKMSGGGVSVALAIADWSVSFE